MDSGGQAPKLEVHVRVADSLAAIGRDIKRNAATLVGLTALLWLVQLVNVTVFHGSLIRWGIQPRSVQGLPGILVHPFLHAGWQHLISNTIGLLMLGGMVMLREPRDFWMVSGLSLVIGGIGIWLFGRSGPHIGASGVVFGYFGYLLLTGWFDRRVGPIVLSILTFLLWGRLLFGLSPFQVGISWEGHLCGLAGGILGAWLRSRARRSRKLGRVALGPIAALSLATPLKAQEASPAAPLSIGETFTVESRVLHETRRINVWVPPVYADSAGVRLPVLYMPDGGVGEDFLHIAGLLQVSIGNGTMRPFLLVGIENTERRRDLTGPTTVESDRKIAPRVGGSEAFRRFIRTELMRLVRSRYRTTGETAIMGESLAGLFVVETFFLESRLFDTYIAFDPSLWWNAHQLVDQAPDRVRSIDVRGRALYLASSRDDIDQLTTRLADLLRGQAPAELTWHFEPMPEESHATIYHPAAIRALRRLFAPPERQ